MKNTLLIAAAIGTVLALVVGASAYDNSITRESRVPNPVSTGAVTLENSRLETLWIFDADFEDLVGDNAGWTSYDRSGTLGSQNFWHHDTIHMWSQDPSYPLGTSTWWCGTYDECWRQARGYGNNWQQHLERHFTETASDAGDITLEFDQRYALEKDYDYAYVDIRSAATSDTFVTLMMGCNSGFAGTPGMNQDWTHNNAQYNTQGHMVIDITPFAQGQEFDLRFRMESDGAYSSQDQWDSPPQSPCLDGAWQLDNITVTSSINGQLFYDDAEGDDPWTHDDAVASGQIGVTWWRGQFGIDFITGRDFTCDDRQVGSWMYAAVDPFTSQMVDNQDSWLVSPPIDVSGAAKLVGHWDQWVDLPRPTDDVFNLSLASDDLYACVTSLDGFVDESPGAWYGGPFWGNWYDDWDAFAGNDWLAIRWEVWNGGEGDGTHMAGVLCNRQRVGVPSGDAGTTWNYGTWDRLYDVFIEELTAATTDSGEIDVKDDDDIAWVNLIATNGTTTNTYAARRLDEEGNIWRFSPPVTEMVPGAEVHYYFEAQDLVGNTSVFPSTAPDNYYEISVLPIDATVTNPGILLVDKHGRRTPSAERDYFHSSEYFYREMLGILGYEWETYDVEVPSGSTDQSDGPDTFAYKYYDTQVWFTDEFDAYTIKPFDQANMIEWLQDAPEKDRNLLITGNDWGKELMASGKETLGFYTIWMASSYIGNSVGVVTVDSVPGIKDGGDATHTFMNHDDGVAVLRGSCPQLHYYDVVDPASGIPGNGVALLYEKNDSSEVGAGVYYTHQTMGYNTVNLGFGMEFMADGVVGDYLTPEGYFRVGVEDRVNLMGNIMDFFDTVPTGPGTGIDNGVKNVLSHAYPNPFNPVTKIAYTVKEAGPVTIEVYNVAGKVVRTLLDTELEGGASGFVTWDGTNDGGERCASGVYFYRINAPQFTESHKMIMLK
jgi:hypothetical protein